MPQYASALTNIGTGMQPPKPKPAQPTFQPTPTLPEGAQGQLDSAGLQRAIVNGGGMSTVNAPPAMSWNSYAATKLPDYVGMLDPPDVVKDGTATVANADGTVTGGNNTGDGAAGGGAENTLGTERADLLNQYNMSALKRSLADVQNSQGLMASRANEMAAQRGGSTFGGLQQAGAAQAQMGTNQMMNQAHEEALKRSLSLAQWGFEGEDRNRWNDREMLARAAEIKAGR